MNIRDAEIDDFLTIASLDRRVWKDNNFIADGEHAWRLWVQYAKVFVAEEDKKIIGVCLLFKSYKSSLYILHKIFIDKKYRNKKIGNNFFKKAIEFLDDEECDCLLTTNPINFKMIHLCEKYGFNKKNLIKGYYRDTEDRLVIERIYRRIK